MNSTGKKSADKILIGIDPDCNKSGVATWNKATRVLTLESNKDLFTLMEYLIMMNSDYNIKVIISAGWLNKKVNFHSRNKKHSIGTRERISERVGGNHEIGKQLVKWCDINLIPNATILPRGKINAKTFKVYTGWNKRSNQEQRDAAMCVFGY